MRMSQEVSPIFLAVEGMHCANCASGIENHLKKSGFNSVAVHFATASIEISANNLDSLALIISEIERLGYQVKKQEQATTTKVPFWNIKNKFLISTIFTTPLLLHMLLPFDFLHNHLVQLGLSAPVFLIGLSHFGLSALKSLRSGFPNMDVLIVIGITASFIYSLIGTLFSLGDNFLFYETSASIVTFVLLGNLLEKHSIKKTTSAIEELIKIKPTKAKRVVTLIGREGIEEIEATQIAINDLVIANSGDKIPSDGVVISGLGLVDQSMISGESLPIEIQSGAKVIGGTILVSGNIKIRATAIGEKSVLANIIRLVRETQIKRPEIQRIGDIVSSYFVPAVLLVSITTLLLSLLVFNLGYQQALLNCIAVLVVACPCAMGLATPTAVMVGLGRALRGGILVKGGATLESLAKVTQVVFDKTGTLTSGSFTIKEIKAFDISYEELMSLVTSLERHSSHPIARSLASQASKYNQIEFSNIKENKGLSIEGKTEQGDNIRIGSYAIARHIIREDYHSLYVLKNELLIGWLDIEDEIRTGSKELIAALHSLNIKTSIMSGDKTEKCQAIAKSIGIDNVYSECLPERKLELVSSLQKNAKVAFVGDGINDAPALAKAETGISLSNASDVAMHSAQVLLLNGEIQQLATAILISRKTLRIIKQNLFWAFFYNTLAIPIAACGYLTPMIAALTMAFSDVIVIGNSLRLRNCNLTER